MYKRQAYWNYRDLMDFTETLIRTIADQAVGSQQLEYQGRPVDLAQPFERLTIREAMSLYLAGTEGRLMRSLKSIIRRSMPMPQPPVGGMPYSRARTKSWS